MNGVCFFDYRIGQRLGRDNNRSVDRDGERRIFQIADFIADTGRETDRAHVGRRSRYRSAGRQRQTGAGQLAEFVTPGKDAGSAGGLQRIGVGLVNRPVGQTCRYHCNRRINNKAESLFVGCRFFIGGDSGKRNSLLRDCRSG